VPESPRGGMHRRARRIGAARKLRVALAVAAVVGGVGCAPAGVTGPEAPHPPAAVPERPAPGPEASPPGGPAGRTSGLGPRGAPRSQASQATPESPSTPGPGEADAEPAGARLDNVPVVSATEPAAARAPAPVRLHYPRIDADVSVVPTGVADDGQMDIPADAGTAGWYRFGMTPGDGRGTTVIAAHAGSRQTPVGPLYALRESRTGDVVEVQDAAGRRHAYRVAAVAQQAKDGLDLTPYFQRDGTPRLVLVTCGGRWIAERGSYADNIMVVAEPVG
jgi:hypothetical protein